MQIKQEFGLALGKWSTLRPRQFTEKRGNYLVYKDKFMWKIHICFLVTIRNKIIPHPTNQKWMGEALYLIAITNCTIISSFNDTYPFSIHPEIQDLDNFNITLTYSMVQSPSWEANWFAASQEIPCISRNPKVHYRPHKCPPQYHTANDISYQSPQPMLPTHNTISPLS